MGALKQREDVKLRARQTGNVVYCMQREREREREEKKEEGNEFV